MDNITKFFIRNSKLSILCILFIVVSGVFSLKNMNAESNPAVNFATAIISTTYSGASSYDIETKITKPIEDEIRQVDDIKDVRSISQPGLSTIIIRIDMDKRGIDIPKSISDIQSSLNRAKLPSDLVDLPFFKEIKSEEFPVVTVAITGSNKNRFRNITADILKEELQDNKSVKSISVIGYNDRRFNIDIDLVKINQYYVGINEVFNKIKSRNIDFPSGEIKNKKSQYLTRIEAKVRNIEELKNIIIRSNFSGKVVRLQDIAKVYDSEEEPRFLARYNSKEAAILTINKKSNTDTLDLVADIKDRVADFSLRYQDRLEFNLIHDESQEVHDRISILTQNAIIGFVIVVSLLFLFLPFRSALAASFSLPISILATLAIMFFLGINLNTITILALVIVLGMLVDNSVIISENFVKYKNRKIASYDSAIRCIKFFWMPITVTILTTIAAFLPMLITRGIMGEFIKWIPIVVTIALLVSLLECFFFLPMRLVYFSKNSNQNNTNNAKSDWFHIFEVKFEKLIVKLVKMRYFVLIGFIIINFISVYLIFFANKFILFPAEQTSIYYAKFKSEEGSRIENTGKIMGNISKKIKNNLKDRVKHIDVRVGLTDLNASRPNYEEGSDVGYMWIYVDDYAKNNISYNKMLSKLRKIKFNIKGDLTFGVRTDGPPVGNDIEATFRSNNLDDINKIITLIKNDLSKKKGIFDLTTDDSMIVDEIFINIDYRKAERLGLDIDKIGNAIKSAIAGSIISTTTINNKEVDLFLRLKEDYRSSINDLRNIMIMDGSQNLVPLGNFVEFIKKKSDPYIKRYDYKRSKTLLGSVNDDIISSLEANNILKQLIKRYQVDFPSVSVSFGGVEESTSESLQSLKRAFIFAVMGIFILMVFLFKSYMKPFIILTTVPLGLIGFSVAFILHSKPISFMALIGIVGLSGVIINSAIVLISYILRLKEEGEIKDLNKILSYASSMRLRSVVITSLTTIAGFAPTAYGIGGKDEILSPMTLSMMWGLAGGTLLTIIWVPCIYAILDDISTCFNKILIKFKIKKI
jgi:multidrug efflux pump subunit AcrB